MYIVLRSVIFYSSVIFHHRSYHWRNNSFHHGINQPTFKKELETVKCPSKNAQLKNNTIL